MLIPEAAAPTAQLSRHTLEVSLLALLHKRPFVAAMAVVDDEATERLRRLDHACGELRAAIAEVG